MSVRPERGDFVPDDAPAEAKAANVTVETKALSVYARRFPVSKEDAERGYVVIDIYRVQLQFGMADPCLNHAMKKIMCPGVRVGGKSAAQDIREAAYSLQRWAEMREEEDDAGK